MIQIFRMRLLYYSDDILMIDIQTDPIKHLLIERLCENEYIGFRFKIL